MIACIRIPYFAVTLAGHDDPALKNQPLVIARYKNGRGRIVAVSQEAALEGVQVGMTLSRARALYPALQVTLLRPGRLRHTLETLQTGLTEYSQWIEVERGIQTVVLYVDPGKLRPSAGRTIAGQILTDFHNRGMAAAIGLAPNKFTALVAASMTQVGEITLIAPGEEARFLAPLPVSLLPLDKEIARRLALLGLRQMGQLATLPRTALIAQFGKSGGRLHRLASGEDARRVARYIPPVTTGINWQFEPPLEDRLVLRSTLNLLTVHLNEKLMAQGMSCREITLMLRLENQVELEVQNRPREPISSGVALGRVIQRLLDQTKPDARITEVEIKLSRLTPTLPRQMSLFEVPEIQDPRAILLDLSERYGEDLFYTVVVNPLQPRLPEWRFLLEKVEAA